MAEPSAVDRVTYLSTLVRTAPPFVGRRQELDLIEGLFQEALAGQPRMLLIEGEAGMGKTRLLREVQLSELRRGVGVFSGRGYEDLALPYLPFIEALQRLLDQPPQDITPALHHDLEIIKRFLHQEETPRLGTEHAMPPRGDQDRLYFFLTMSQAIVRLAQHCPALFIVDDLHWADRSSLDLFGHLVFTVADTAVRESVPLLIIGTYRPVEAETHLARLIARLQRELMCRTFTLTGLSESEIHALVQGLGLPRSSHQLITTVSGATQGNPLFIQEVLHHLVQQDALQDRGGYLVTTAAAADLQLPDQVTGAIVSRVRKLDQECQRVLAFASLLGDSFSVQILSAVSGLCEDDLLDLLEEVIRQRLLQSEGEVFRFAHPLVRHVFYHESSQVRRQRMHRQIAETLERLYAGDPDEHVLEIVHHLIRSGPLAAAEKVVKYARKAGDQAFKVFAWGDSARYYEGALASAETKNYLSIQDQAELHYLAGLAFYRDQDVGPCLDHYERAIDAYQVIGDVRGLARVLMEKTRTQYTLASAPYGTLIDMQSLQDVLARLGESEPGLRGRITAVMAQAYWHAGRAAETTEMAQRALEIGQAIEDNHLCSRASSALALAQMNNLQVREALESWRTALAYARKADDLVLQGRPLQRMPAALTMQGRLDEAESVALEACELARTTHDWGEGYSVALANLASIALAHGNFTATERHAHETILMVDRFGYPWAGTRALLALACSRAMLGSWTEAEDALNVLIEPGRVFREPGPVIQAFARTFRELLRAYAGTVDDTIVPQAAELVRALGTGAYSLAPLCALVELGDLIAAPSVAESPVKVLHRVAEQGVVFSSGWVFLIPRVLGVAAALTRRWDVAETHFQAAVDVASSVAAQPELGRTYLDYARMLVARGVRSDRSRASDLLILASTLFHKLGMVPFLGRTADLAQLIRAPKSLLPQPPGIYPGNLSDIEVQVLSHIAQGRTNQEIANRLVMSSRTVAHHVSCLYKKISVNNRPAAVAYARRHGLASQLKPDRVVGPTSIPSRILDEITPPVPHILLVTDIEGSTVLIQRLGDAKAHELLTVHNTILRDCLRRYRGSEITHTGDGIEASFLSASSAISCAVAMQKAFAEYTRVNLAHPIRIRIGINAGETILTEGRLFGRAVHATFRICARAQPGQILVSDVIHQLVAGQDFIFVDHGRMALKGLAERMRLYEVLWKRESPQ